MAKSKKDSLGDRMKEYYENRSKTYLTRRTPVIIRLDGKAFHSFTRGFERPYDAVFHNTMNETLKYLCNNIQGCKLGYTQSDEITLLLTDYDTLTTDAWFGYAVQKMCSISASLATYQFNKAFREEVMKWWDDHSYINHLGNTCAESESVSKLKEVYSKAIIKGAFFDSRCFNVPLNDVTNCFVWRQQDATRNAIQMLGQTYFSSKQLENKSCNDIQEMLFSQKGINFNDCPIEFKRGICCYRDSQSNKWVIDKNIPIFTQDRNYVERFVFVENEGDNQCTRNL